MIDFKPPKKSFFAAANGFDGFISAFPKIFNPGDYDRIFVLKGGPGTGKSSLLKALCAFGEENGCFVEAIFCSSDPNSLDGVILEKNGKKIAALDGTAPHQTDAVLPGAVDEIVNLGDGFNVPKLTASRKKITELNKKKKYAYRKAYEFLYLAGQIDNEIRSLISECTDSNKAKILAEKIIQNTSFVGEKSLSKERYISSFGRLGYVRLPVSHNGKTVKIRGEHTSQILMKYLRKFIGNADCICPSPFRYSDTEAIYTNDCVYLCSDDGEIDADEILIGVPRFLTDLERTKYEFLDIAKSYFEEASVNHFELEKIYIDAMNFTNNDRLLGEISEHSLEILSK